MNPPIVVCRAGFQDAYLDALSEVRDRGWACWNLNVQIASPTDFDPVIHERISKFALDAGAKSPKDVAYTIFPQGVWERSADSNDFYARYLDRFFPRVHRRAHRWGTYFARMLAWQYEGHAPVNQLGSIIDSINGSDDVHKAAYSILIARPGGETRQPMGAPCLSLVTLQLEREPVKTANLYAVYRNHDFLGRAYGNYWGLSQLLSFIAEETDYAIGCVTCSSSHAFVDGKKTLVSELLSETGR